MARNANNQLLHQAKVAKSDEFYTQYEDIERELAYYKDKFRGKTVYCNCDDPQTSNFVSFFLDKFNELGLKRLVASCYSPMHYDLFELDEAVAGRYCIVERQGEEMAINQLRGDGDFRSAECIALLKEADIVVTNPPFSLFREYIAQLMRHNKQFLVIGNINAITYKEIFQWIQQDKVWLGVHLGRGISGFIVPEHYELFGTEARINENGQRIVAPNNCLWLTNLDNGIRHSFLNLTRQYEGNEDAYPIYDNYHAINVNRTQDIPFDYPGVMGVPITFLHKYNPDQFEIVKFRKGNDDKDLRVNGKCPYFRILVRNRMYKIVS